EEDGARARIQNALRFDVEGEAVDGRLFRPHAELVNRVALRIEALHDAEAAAINRRAEEARDAHIARVLQRRGERRELRLAIRAEARVEELEAQQLVLLVGAQADRALLQAPAQVG